MTDEHLDEALKDLRAELTVTPSPEFAVKVRERIERAPTRWSWNVWAWAGVAATCAVAVIAVAMWRGETQKTGGSQPVMLTEARPVVTAEPPAGSRPVPVVPTVTPSARSAAAPVVRAASGRSEPEVLVPPDQLIAIRRLMAAVRVGSAVSVPASLAVFDPETGELMPPTPIEIPLITVEPLPGDPNVRSGGREDQ